MSKNVIVVGVIVLLLLGFGSIYYTYLSTTTNLPAVGLGMEIDSSVLLGSIVLLGLVMAVLLFGYLRGSPTKE